MGTDWKVDELRTIADRLLGTVEIIREPSGLKDDFGVLMAASMAKRVNDIQLKKSCMNGAGRSPSCVGADRGAGGRGWRRSGGIGAG